MATESPPNVRAFAALVAFGIATFVVLSGPLWLTRVRAWRPLPSFYGGVGAMITLLLALAALPRDTPEALVLIGGGLGAVTIVTGVIADYWFRKADERLAKQRHEEHRDRLDENTKVLVQTQRLLNAATRHDIRRRAFGLAREIEKRIIRYEDSTQTYQDAKNQQLLEGTILQAQSEVQVEHFKATTRAVRDFAGPIRDLVLETGSTLDIDTDEMREIAGLLQEMVKDYHITTVDQMKWLASCLRGLARKIPWQ